MLSLDLLYAVLQGLPASHLKHLDRPWMLFCERIEAALKGGQTPAAALRFALEKCSQYEFGAIKKAIAQTVAVRRLRELSYRQKELLTALRVAKVASLSQLCCVVLQDRSHAFRRLAALIKRGYVLKFYKPGGVYYMAIDAPLTKYARAEVNDLLVKLIDELGGTNLNKVQKVQQVQQVQDLQKVQRRIDGA